MLIGAAGVLSKPRHKTSTPEDITHNSNLLIPFDKVFLVDAYCIDPKINIRVVGFV